MILITIEQFKEVITNLDSNFEDITEFQTYIDSAEDWLKREIIGEELYNYLQSDSGPQGGEIFRKVRKPIALYAYLLAIPYLDVIQTKQGMGVVNTNNISPASKDRVNKVKEALKADLDYSVEDLIEYLETAENTIKEKWQASSAYSKIFDVLVYSVRDFSDYIELNNNRRLFMKMKSSMITVHKNVIAKAISENYLNELVGKQSSGELEEADTAIIENLKHAICLFTISKGLDNLSVMITTGGLVKEYEIGSTSAASEVQVNMLRRSYDKDANDLLRLVIDHMHDNIDNYPTYADSKEYARKTYTGYENEEDSSLFVSP